MAFNLYGRNGSLADPQDVLWTHLDNAKRVAEERRDVPSSMSRNAGVSTRPSSGRFEEVGAFLPEFASVARENPDAVYDFATRAFRFTQALKDAENGVFGREVD